MQEVNLPDTLWQVQWRYYNDGKAWLCKVSYKKKTVFWLSVWEACFKVAFYFTEKNSQGLMNLPLDASVKEAFLASKPIGKLLPMVFSITRVEQISEVMQVANYKKDLK